ncbi:MAG TPA: hypothetical protein VGW75_12015 [Solirubrobacteraceae bacterium]|jgi:hypothetical protein|nr:hypothetical protein [Solirubrobacteraceae bacterium]
MADTDPFGRDKGEDPLAEMGWTSSNAETGAAEVAAPERPDRAARQRARADRVTALLGEGADRAAERLGGTRTAERATGRVPASGSLAGRAPTITGIPGDRPRRRGLGCAFAVVVLLFIGAVGVFVAALVGDAIETVDDALPTLPAPNDAPPSAEPPRGLGRASLLRDENLAPALRRLRRLTKAPRVRLVRLDAGTLLVQSVAPDGTTQFARTTWRGDASVLSTTPGGGAEGFAWSRIDPAAPARIVRAATRGRRPSEFDYLVLTNVPELRWSAFLRAGAGTFLASPDGRRVQRAG